MFSVKVTHNNEVRRVQLELDSNKVNEFARMQNVIRNIFPDLVNKPFSLIWKDDEGDKVTVSGDQELHEAVRVLLSFNSVLKFEVKVGEVTRAHSKAVHTGVTCDECGVSPIQGTRFKCAIRNDYDLCETCEAKTAQPHAMLKIVDPSQAPAALIFAINDSQPRSRGEHGHGHHHDRRHGGPGMCGGRGSGGHHPHMFGGRGHFPGGRGHFGGPAHFGGPFGHPHHPHHAHSPFVGSFGGPSFGSWLPHYAPAPHAAYPGPFAPQHAYPFNPFAQSAPPAAEEAFPADPPMEYLNVEVPLGGGGSRCGGRWNKGCRRQERKARVGDFVSNLLETLLGGQNQCPKPDQPSAASNATATDAQKTDSSEPGPVNTLTPESVLSAAAAFASAFTRDRDLNDEDEALQRAISDSITATDKTTAAADSEEQEEDVEDVPLPGAADYVGVTTNTTAPVLAIPVTAEIRNVDGAAESKEEEPATPTIPAPAATTSSPYELWHRELQLLASMGFVDFAAMIPLLAKFVETPGVHSAQHVEGMQRVVATLLTQNGVNI